MVVNGRPLKRMKRRITADLYDFLTFPTAGDMFSSRLDGPFRSNVRSFLSKHARLPPPHSLFPHLLTWQILFRIGDLTEGPDSTPAVVALDIVEEDVVSSRSVYCNQCRVVGWSGHPVCRKRYHFIIRADSRSIQGYQKSCTNCGEVLHLSDSRCKSCSYVMTAYDFEDWVNLQLEDTTHLLHGVVHTNGYGHLLRVNGREGGSKFLTGCDIMDFWDRLCKTLAVSGAIFPLNRKVSVMDASKKYGLEYRLLHGITNGHPWYGEWGYQFGSGSFALTLDAYQKAVDTLSDIPLSSFFSQGRKPRTRLQDVIVFYQSLSECELVKTRDLFCFLMRLIHDTHKSPNATCKKSESCSSRVLCAWTKDDVQRVEQTMIKVLIAVGANWVTWRALRGATCKVASTELLDYCLKDLGGKLAADGRVVHTQCNPNSNAMEYKLEPVSVAPPAFPFLKSNFPSEEHLLRDMKFLYDSILHPQTMLSYRPQKMREVAIRSAKKLLDCKQFVKDYKPDKMANKTPFAIRISCQVELVDHPKDYTAPPPELIVLLPNATVADLKIEATKAFNEVYVMFKRFRAEELLDYGCIEDCTCVNFLVGSRGSVRIRGRCVGGENELNRFRMERGTDIWTVDCSCGAKDDDGERMLACDTCGVWQHTRCAGIQDSDAVPAKFMCDSCRSTCRKGSTRPTKAGRHCKDETVASAAVAFESNFTVPFGVS
ncbi:hypothetical protein HHK36_004585 [Tetracentron sinense]|uniref:Zinc finger PHD-type domain-containing protein n=1 Tax=Tetracentron sinense TaxID=13715 RepID=A0A834ZR52_TETSI|nr:hypothetical protein HHK36_004585 [Tetracentron sinense]